ncbi:MAG: hypothetical protein WBI04_01570 [Trichlorobacter sp.]|jgi:hypothetical protein
MVAFIVLLRHPQGVQESKYPQVGLIEQHRQLVSEKRLAEQEALHGTAPLLLSGFGLLAGGLKYPLGTSAGMARQAMMLTGSR